MLVCAQSENFECDGRGESYIKVIMSDDVSLQKTALFDTHQKLGARLVDFGGWQMPVQYSGILEEHKAVREAAGVFDISHMGEFFVSGHDALTFLNGLLTNDAE